MLRIQTAFVVIMWVATLGCAHSSPEDTADNERRARAHYSVAMDHLQEGRNAMAIRELQAASELVPEDPWVELSLAEALTRRGKTDEAEVHLRRALRMREGFQPALLNLSALFIAQERFEEAIEISDQLLDDATFPVPWKALTNKGYAQFRLGRLAEARQQYELALEYHERFWPALLDLAILDSEERRNVEALEGLERVLEISPGPLAEAEANYRMAVIYISLGNRAKAVHHLTTSAKSRPSGQWGKRSEDYLKRMR
jgi:type IV pilus assembly protein PilF